jgi:hypothetical protein
MQFNLSSQVHCFWKLAVQANVLCVVELHQHLALYHTMMACPTCVSRVQQLLFKTAFMPTDLPSLDASSTASRVG